MAIAQSCCYFNSQNNQLICIMDLYLYQQITLVISTKRGKIVKNGKVN